MRRTLAVLASLLAVTASLAAIAGPAHADGLAVRDGRGDVWRISPTGSRPAARMQNGDVSRTLFRHGADNVIVLSWYVGLARVGRYAQFTVRIQTDAGTYREVQVETSRSNRAGTARVFARNGNRVACRVGHAISYRRDTVRMAVPRTCLRDPAHVRATAASYWAQRQVFTDNPHNREAEVAVWTRWLAAG